MIFSRDYTTNWHDTDATRCVRPSRHLVYMQETSNHHMTSVGPSLDRLRDENGLAFILSRISFRIYRPLYAFEDITVETWTSTGRGFSTVRCYRIRRGGEIISEAHTVWALVDINSRKFCRMSDCDVYAFEDEEPLELDMPQRFRLPEGCELCEIGKRRIVYSDLDYNMHMNNTHYPDMLCDFMPIDKAAKIKGMTLSYLREAAFGDTLSVMCAESDGVYYFRTLGNDGAPCLEACVFTQT